MVIEGTAMWASIKSPNTRDEPKYTIDLVVDNKTAQDLNKQGFTVKFDKEEGPTINIKRMVNGPNGMIRKPPALLDKSKQDMDCAVGNGSKVKVQARPWEITRSGQQYKGLELQAVQVIDLVNYNAGDGDEFDTIVEEAEVSEL